MGDPAERSIAEAAARLQAIREARMRAADQPSLADQARFRGQPAALRRAMNARADPTVTTLLATFAARLKVQARVLAAAGEAVRQAISREISAQTCPVEFGNGTLTLAVPDDGIRFRLDRELRAGGEGAILRALPAPVRRIKVIVSKEPVAAPDEPRRACTEGESERDRWDEVDADVESAHGRGYRCPECDWEFAINLRRGPSAENAPERRLVAVRCPNCNSIGRFRVGE